MGLISVITDPLVGSGKMPNLSSDIDMPWVYQGIIYMYDVCAWDYSNEALAKK